LPGKVVVLTGASSGLGRATALELARRGAILHLVARRSELLDRVCGEVEELGGVASAYVTDLRDPVAVEGLIAEIHAAVGAVDVLINNAGAGPLKSFLDTTDDDWEWTLDVNVRALVQLTRGLLPAMLERRRGTIVNVASLAGLMANPLSAYTASKFAVVGLSESLLIEYGGRGIDVVVVCPGAIDTGMAEAALQEGRSEPAVETRMRAFLGKYGVQAEVVARDVVNAIERPRFLVLSPPHAVVLNAVHRLFPAAMRRVFRRFGESNAQDTVQ
jgi:short-subunit dehydrogenase